MQEYGKGSMIFCHKFVITFFAMTVIVSAVPQRYGSRYGSRSKCSGVTVPANNGKNEIHGECKSLNNGQLFCYVDKSTGPCEDYSQKFNVLCICYSCCKSISNAAAYGFGKKWFTPCGHDSKSFFSLFKTHNKQEDFKINFAACSP